MPIGKSTRRFAIFSIACLYCWFGLGSTLSDVQSHASGNDTGVRQTIDSGVEFERSRAWLKAIEHYEEALKGWPENDELKYGLRRSQIHFSIERRYTDSSFLNDLRPMSRYEAMDVMDEVLRKVKTDYVDRISTTSLIAHGTESLYLALANPNFLEANLPAADPERIKKLRGILREQFWNKPIPRYSEAALVVGDVCDTADRLLGLPSGAVIMEYVFGSFNALDDYSSCLTPSRWNDLFDNIKGEFVGLGIEMKADKGNGLLLVNVLPDSPAAEGGILPGDHIISIDGSDCREMTTEAAASLLRGIAGSKVLLEVRSPDRIDAVRPARLVRRAVHVKSIPVARIIDKEYGVGYVQMTGFQQNSEDELDQALRMLERQGMRALIWDLRGNPGGLLSSAHKVLDRFIEDGVLVATRGRVEDQNYTYRATRMQKWTMPLVLLVDGDSASASEIVAGAIRDHQRGTIVGRQTYGKWSVQSLLGTRGSMGLRLTTAKFYSPNGHTLGKIGVKPDKLVEAPPTRQTHYRGLASSDPQTDRDVQVGLESLRQRITQR